MGKTLKIIPPLMPNFYYYEHPPRPRQEGIGNNASHPIENLSREEAEQFGELMKQEFIKHWERKQPQEISTTIKP